MRLNLALVVSGEELDAQSFTLDSIVSGSTLCMSRFPHPHARFGDRFVEVHAEPVAQAPANQDRLLALDSLGGELSDRISLSAFRASSLVALGDATPVPDTSQITITVLDDRGEPAVHALVALGHEFNGTDRTAFTDEHGLAVIDSIAGGWWEVRAGGGVGGLARERLFVDAPNPMHWSVHLDRGARIVGRVLDAEGKPALNMIVRYESVPAVVLRSTSVSLSVETRSGEEISEHGEPRAVVPGELRVPWVDQTSPRDDGTFELANLPGGLGRLLVLDKDQPDASAIVVEEGVLAGEHEYVLRIPAESGTLRVRVQLPLALDNVQIEVRVISESTGRGSAVHDEKDGGLESSALATGWYRVEVGAGCFGWHDLGRQFVGPAAHVDLGTFTPPLPATVHVIPRAPAVGEQPSLDLTFYLRRSDLDVRGEPRSLRGGDSFYLPAGEYWAFWTANDGAIQHRPMKLEAGATTELDLR